MAHDFGDHEFGHTRNGHLFAVNLHGLIGDGLNALFFYDDVVEPLNGRAGHFFGLFTLGKFHRVIDLGNQRIAVVAVGGVRPVIFGAISLLCGGGLSPVCLRSVVVGKTGLLISGARRQRERAHQGKA